MICLLALLILFLSLELQADLQSYMPGGVAYDVRIQSETDSNYNFKIYGSQLINCPRLNNTPNADVGFNTSDHTGLKYNFQYSCNRLEYSRPDSDSFTVLQGITQSEYDFDFSYPKSNLINALGNSEYIVVRFRFGMFRANCSNEEHESDGVTYWMHNRSFIPDSSIGADIEVTYLYKSFIYDGELHDLPSLSITNITDQYYQETDNWLDKAYIQVDCNGLTASQLEDLTVDQCFIYVQLTESGEPVQSAFATSLPLSGWSDVSGENGVTARCIFEYSPNWLEVGRYWKTFSFSAHLNLYGSTQNTGSVLQTLGNRRSVNDLYFIQWSVTENGTINAYVVQQLRSLGSVSQTFYNDTAIKWTCNDYSAIGNRLVYNPYNGESSRDVARLQIVTAQFTVTSQEDGERNVNLMQYVQLPPLGQTSEEETEGEIENKPDEEDQEPETENFTPTAEIEQTNDLLNQLIQEFKNGRDEELAYFKEMSQFMDIDDTSIDYTSDSSPDEPSGDSLMGSLETGLEGELGGSLDYEQGLGSGFGNGVGSNLEQFKNLGTKDISFTIDARAVNSMFPDMDCSDWVWTVHLLPDTSTEFGQGVERVVTNYIRPIILFFLYFVLGVTCIKDISAFFGNGSET